MDKQQQVLEMAKDICRVKLNCNDVCNPISACNALKYAERAVEAGYCKHREAAWRFTGYSLTGQRAYQCTNCGFAVANIDDVNMKFCPGCGAKMKGGAEE